MGHGLLQNDEMFSVGQRPWHGLGKVVTEAPSIEEAIILANLGWTVETKKIKTEDEKFIPGKKAVVRSDNNDCLGIVSDGYKVLQNTEAFKFFEPFIENNMATLETAGSLFNGRKVFILAKIAGDDMVIDEKYNDTVEKYILLSNAHDASSAVRVGFTSVRVVCNNTLTCAEESKDSQLIRVHHTGKLVENMEQLRNTMDLVNQQFIATEEMYKQLASMPYNTGDLEKYIKRIFSKKSLEKMYETPSEYSEEEVSKARKRLIQRAEEVFEMEPVHNRWTMYNAVNYYFNHDKGRTLETTYNSMWFGDTKRLDKKAFALAFEPEL